MLMMQLGSNTYLMAQKLYKSVCWNFVEAVLLHPRGSEQVVGACAGLLSLPFGC
ncbi:unnamed protein product [Linum tenue]|uniref:Uncharacterized protein n=1 Tax=Linum tenue TaxID=586396 RepID=A0AAV0QKG9_9ROSI|nr:unnamed protein product [Linum tenue]